MSQPKSRTLRHLISGLLGGAAILSSQALLAAQGAGQIATEPLFLATPEPPNIMLLLDSTGSMARTLAGDQVSDNRFLRLVNPSRMTVLKNVFLGTQRDTSLACNRISGANFRARCFAANVDSVGLFDAGVFDNTNVGLADFFSDSNGSKIRLFANIDDIASNVNELKADIFDIQPAGGTPLALALQAMGRYFAQGSSTPLTLHPGTADEFTLSANTVFSQTLTTSFRKSNENRARLEAPTAPIDRARFCATNNVILLTDGEPTTDSRLNANSGLRDYDADGVECLNDTSGTQCNFINFDRRDRFNRRTPGGSDYLDDVALALQDIDLRPDVRDVNNVTTHVIGFGADVLELPILRDTVNHSGGLLRTAINADELTAAIQAIAARAIRDPASSAAASFNNSQVTVGSFAYRTEFTSGIWRGELSAFTIDPSTGKVDEGCTTTNSATCWKASVLLGARDPNTRNIITLGANGEGVAFTADNSTQFNSRLQQDLGSDAENIIAFIRGDRSLEGSTFRDRDGVLGDIIASEATFSDGVLYVGANDGMLHAFDAVTGAEIFAYIPGGIASDAPDAGLHYLASRNYIHQPYVDMTPIVTELNGRKILIGGYGAGGKGLFALDVTSPNTFNASNVLWEFTAEDARTAGGDSLGFNFTPPVVASINGQKNLIFGNGFASGDGAVSLFTVNLAGPGGDNTWQADADFTVVTTDGGVNDGLGGVTVKFVKDANAVDTDEANIVYAGSLNGDLWAFLDGSAAPRRIFSAGSDQPITAAPSAIEKLVSNNTQYRVFFGTGAFFADGDNENADQQAFYNVTDNRVNGDLTPDSLTQLTVTEIPGEENAAGETQSTTRVTSLADDLASASFGWFINLPRDFERSLFQPTLIDGFVTFATSIPEEVTDEQGNPIPCSSGGSGFVMILDQRTGFSPNRPVFDFNGDFRVNTLDLISVDGEQTAPGGFEVDSLPTSPRILERDNSRIDLNVERDIPDNDLFVNTTNGISETGLLLGIRQSTPDEPEDPTPEEPTPEPEPPTPSPNPPTEPTPESEPEPAPEPEPTPPSFERKSWREMR